MPAANVKWGNATSDAAWNAVTPASGDNKVTEASFAAAGRA